MVDLSGFGLGILTLSSITETIIFGHYSNKMTTYQKYTFKVSMDSMNSIYDSSITIAVLGCFAFIFSLISVVFLFKDFLHILFISELLLLIFTFGCIVAEGIISQKIKNQYAYDLSDSNNHYVFQAFSNKSARNYIK